MGGGVRQKRSYPILNPNSNSDIFIDDDEDSERVKRAADPTNSEPNRRNSQEIKIEPLKFPQRENYQGTRNRGGSGRNSNNRNSQLYTNSGNSRNDNSKEPSLDKLIKEIRQKVKDTKKFWSNLPYTACNSEELPTAGNSDSCWNGQTVNRLEKFI